MRRLRHSSARTRRSVGLAFALFTLAATASTAIVVRAPQRASAASTGGYWLVGTDGGIFSFGQATFFGSTGNIPLNQPIVGMAPTATGRGYWMVAADGGIFAFGDAGFYGSMGGKPLNKPIVAMAPSKSGRGYWLVAADGGIFAFGDASFHGSTGAMKLNKPIVDMAATPSGRGYWLAATDGGIFAFGDAGFFGSTGSIDLAKRIHAMSGTPSGRGYWLVAGDGGIFAFGDAGFHGSPAAAGGELEKRVIDMAPSASGRGYYITTSNGQVMPYGDAKGYGGTDEMRLNNRIVAMAALNSNEPPVALDDVVSIDEDLSIDIDVLANDRDPDGGALTLRSVSATPRGNASVSGRNVSYRPMPEFNGTDSFTYVVADDRGDVTTGRVNVTIKPVDDRPNAADDTATVLEDIPLNIPVLLNDGGLGDALKSVSVTGGPNHGTATVNAADKTITYRPAAEYTGPDSLEYRVTDIDDDASTARVTITVIPVNDIPLAFDDSASVRAGRSVTIDVKANDDSPDGFRYFKFADDAGNPIEAGDVTTLAGGTATREGSGRFSYRPARGFGGGTDSFRYVVVDDDGDVSAPATVTISVGANLPPEISSGGGTFEVTQGEPAVTGNLNDIVRDPEDDRLTFALVSSGFVPVTVDSDGRFRYGPAETPGTDEFTFSVSDGTNERTGKVTVTIHPAATTTTTSPPPPEPGPGAFLAPFGPAAASGWARRRLRRREADAQLG